MADDLAAANVNRAYQLAASCIAIFTFLLFFLYPRFLSGDVDSGLYQATLIVMGMATFSFAFASFYYYGAGSMPVRRPRSIPSRRPLLAARLRAPVPGSQLDPLYRRAPRRRVRVVLALACVRVLRAPHFLSRPNRRDELSPGRGFDEG